MNHKDKMLQEIKFPILTPRVNEFQSLLGNEPCCDSWIFCYVNIKDHTLPALYKWAIENNPSNIVAWTYINILATTGLCRWIEYPHLKDDKVILICEEGNKDLIIKI